MKSYRHQTVPSMRRMIFVHKACEKSKFSIFINSILLNFLQCYVIFPQIWPNSGLLYIVTFITFFNQNFSIIIHTIYNDPHSTNYNHNNAWHIRISLYICVYTVTKIKLWRSKKNQLIFNTCNIEKNIYCGKKK